MKCIELYITKSIRGVITDSLINVNIISKFHTEQIKLIVVHV